MRQVLRFFVVGVANTIVCFGTIFLVRGTGASVGLSSAAGYAVGMTQGFLLNRYWTFAGIDHATPVPLQIAAFIVVNLICGSLFTQLNVMLVGVLQATAALSASLKLLLSSIVATAIVTPLSFVLNRWIVFRPRR